MRNLTWTQADYIAKYFGRKIRRENWKPTVSEPEGGMWILYSTTAYLYFTLRPNIDPAANPEGNYHVVKPTEHRIQEWYANDWTDEDWDLTVPIPPTIDIPPGGSNGEPPPPPPPPPGGGGGPTPPGGGSGGFPGGGSGGGGGSSGGGAAYPPRDPHPEDPPETPDPVVIDLAAHFTEPDNDYPTQWSSAGEDGIVESEDDFILPGGPGTDPYPNGESSPYVSGHTQCWTELGYPTPDAELFFTVTVTGGRPGTANGTLRNVDGSVAIFTMGVPGSYTSSVMVPYISKMYVARVGMPPEHALDLAIDVLSNEVYPTTFPKCSDIGL